MRPLVTLDRKTIMITGAASGIGKATAVLCRQLGARVILVDRSEEDLNNQEIQDCEYHVIDLSELNKIEALVENIAETNGSIDGLVHCAGISSRKPLNVLKKDGFSKILNLDKKSEYSIFLKLPKELNSS